MEAETLAGLMGFGGALVGAGVSMWATVITQRHEAKTARIQRVEERGRAAGERALTELYALRRHIMECTQDPIPEERQPWRKIAHDHMGEAQAALALMPGAKKVRERVTEALTIIERKIFEARRGDMGSIMEMMALSRGAGEGIEVLSAYMRGEGVPQPSRWVLDYRRDQANRPPSPGGWGPDEPPS
ncbi:hypothetical protein [Streptomyces sp. 2A115]|uniref:hypothetical protein n=1 Tax=Streptomyces sp. 2A115 TaxID=3457439 RepID=UPI003FD53E0A